MIKKSSILPICLMHNLIYIYFITSQSPSNNSEPITKCLLLPLCASLMKLDYTMLDRAFQLIYVLLPLSPYALPVQQRVQGNRVGIQGDG